MTVIEYQQLAMRTSNNALDGGEHVINGALGLCGEAGEVKIANTRSEIIEETGDVCWYMAEMATALGIGLETVFENCNRTFIWTPNVAADRLLIAAAGIADCIKKSFMQGHRFDEEQIKRQLSNVAKAIDAIAKWYEISVIDIMAGNIKKLAARYPEGRFEIDRSVNREE